MNDLKDKKQGKKITGKTKKGKSLNEDVEMMQVPMDNNSLIKINKKLVKVQYPGVVHNIDNALETLGGLESVELAVADFKNKLELRFHIKNKFNKPCTAERNLNPGILIKIIEKLKTDPNAEQEYDYEVVGITVVNFTFNRAIDFQYLPLIAESSESPEINVEYMYNKIFMDKIPTLKDFLSPETKDQNIFFIPPVFSRFEYANQNRLYLHTGEKFEHHVRPEIAESVINNTKKRKTLNISTKQISIFINFNKRNVQIPEKPLDYTLEIIKDRQLEEKYKIVKSLFDKRPCWTKAAVVHRTGVTYEHLKVVLPATAYFCNIGPWRMSWIRFGYNPQKESGSRIYQTLDYRIRAAEGTKLKVNAKRSYSSKSLFYHFSKTNLHNVTLTEKMANSRKFTVDERSYILKPTTIPPARQMFYQFCDIHIPEIQGMLARLPKAHSEADYVVKDGWLPHNFIEQCREIVNNSVLTQVQEQLLEDSKKLKEQSAKVKEQSSKQFTPTYCSEMLSNIKKGLYKSVKIVDPSQPSTSRMESTKSDENEIQTIDLLNEENELEHINADDVIANTIPEHLDDNSDEEHMSQASEFDIDMEAVEEVNKIITGIQQEESEEVNVVASYLKKL